MIRIVLVALTVVPFLVFSIPILVVLGIQKKRNPGQVQTKSLYMVQGVFRFILKLAGVTYEAQGLENIPRGRTVLYVGNHRSYLDILIGYVTVPGLTGLMTKREMLKAPLLWNWVRKVSCLFLDRVGIKEGLKTILEGTDKVKSDISIRIFPEGACNENEDMAELLPLYEGSLKIAQKSGCPVIPMAIVGTAPTFEQYLPLIKSSHVIIRYGEPIYIKELPPESRKFPGSHTRNIISGMLREMNQAQDSGDKKAQTEKCHQKIEPKCRTERQNRKTELKDRAERQNRSIEGPWEIWTYKRSEGNWMRSTNSW